MGADLYRKGLDTIRARYETDWNAAIKQRNAVLEAWETENPTEAATCRATSWDIDDRPYPDFIRDYIKRAADLYDAMNPPSHYFRDSYNSSSLFWKLDLSWWQDTFPDDSDQSDEDGYSPPSVAAALLAKVSAPGQLDKLKAIEDPESRTYFLEKYDRLCHFLQASIEAGDPILYSV